MHAWMDGWMDGRMVGWKDGRKDGWVDGWTGGRCMDQYMYVCMYVCRKITGSDVHLHDKPSAVKLLQSKRCILVSIRNLHGTKACNLMPT